MSLYVGIDLHSNNMFVAIMNADEELLFQKRLSNDETLILQELSRYPTEEISIVVESTFNWYWLVDALMSHGYSVKLANPAAMVQYSGLKHTDDRSDAIWLARMLKMNLIKEGYIYPKENRPIRDLMRRRMMFIQQRTQMILSLKSLIRRELGQRVSTNMILGERKPLPIKEMFFDEDLLFTAERMLSAIYELKNNAKQIERRVEKKLKLKSEFQNLTTINGIGPILAFTIMLEVGDISRFKTVGDFSSYCRCVSSQRTSNNKVKGKGNKKNGNKYLEWAFVEAANFIKRFNTNAQRFYQKKEAKTNAIVATKALAHKIARASYYIIRDNVPFDDEKLFNYSPPVNS